ncbi:MAG: DUF1059 domain-containing protein [Candidatus Micrarchaeaceae archaeon]
MKSFACRDIGMDCKFTAKANDEATMLKKIAEHARKAHNITNIDDAMMSKVKAAIKDI